MWECNCESSLCDHGAWDNLKPCTRKITGKIKMEFVGECCETCANNMIAQGGAYNIWIEYRGEWKRVSEVNEITLADYLNLIRPE